MENDKIVDIAAQLFMQFGIRNNTMDDLAHKAGLSKKTLYQLVADKESLIETIIEKEYNKTKTAIEAIKSNSKDCIESLIRVSSLIIVFLKEVNPIAILDLKKLYQPLFDKATNNFRSLYTQAIVEQIIAGKLAGFIRSDINEQIIAQLHTDKIDQMQLSSEFWGKQVLGEDIIKEMLTYYMRGLVTKQGETLLNHHILELNTYLNE